MEIISKDNKLIKEVHRLVSDSKERRENRAFVIEGVRLCVDAMKSDVVIESFFFTEEARNKYSEAVSELSSYAHNVYEISNEVSAKMTDTKTPQGIYCVCKMPQNHFELSEIKKEGRFTALENVQDPSNMGTILRTCEALGFDGVIISSNSCDIYNPKVLRGSMGAVFRIKIFITEEFPKTISALKLTGMRPLASVPDPHAVSITSVRFFRGVIMCIGNEGNGLTDETIKACGERITIPMKGRAESLNAATAASILMWEMSRDIK